MNLIQLLLTAPQDNEVAWIDKDKREYRMRDIQDSHLLNILRFICRGNGDPSFVTDDRIRALFDEADRRKLKHFSNLSVAIRAMRDKREMSLIHELFLFGED